MELRKKIGIILIATILIQLVSPIMGEIKFGQEVKATTTADGIFEYEVLEDGTISITGYRGTDTEVIIPETIEGKKVTKIGKDEEGGVRYNPFSHSNITSIKIPSGVTKLESSAFSGCSSLEKVELPEGLTKIEGFAFEECISLQTLKIPSTVTTIEGYSFQNCYNLKNITIPEKVTKIDDRTFSGCTSLTNITMPSTLTEIGYYAFEECEALISITIPKEITKIGASAFEGCSSLENINVDENNSNYCSMDGVLFNKDKSEIIKYPEGKKEKSYYIPKDTNTVSEYAFRKNKELVSINISENINKINIGSFNKASSLENINVDENNSNYCSMDGVLFNKDKTEIIRYPEGKKETNYTIPASVTFICKYAFYLCTNVIEVKIPSGTKTIGASVFSGCSSLEKVELPEGLTEIESFAFSKCISLQTIEIPSTVTTIEGYSFQNCYNLKNITIPEKVTRIDDRTFSGCTSLTNITMPSTLTEIGKEAFEGCSSLESIEIPLTVTLIGWDAFKDCSSLTSIKIPKEITKIGAGAFEGCSSLEKVELPEGLTEIDGHAFKGCSSLEKVELPEGLTEIESSAFEECISLKNIEIPEKITSIAGNTFKNCKALQSIKMMGEITEIGYYAFEGCSSLESIEIPSTVTLIESDAFKDCSSLTSIKIPEGVIYLGSPWFNGCSSLESINVDANNPNYCSVDGVLLNKNQTSIFRYPEGKKDKTYCISENVSSIQDYAFESCRNLESIFVDSANHDYISKDGVLFRTYRKDTLVVYPAGKKDETYSIPEDTSGIGTDAFNGCSYLKNINLSSEVSLDGAIWEAFSGCISLENINVDKDNPNYCSIDGILFNKDKSQIIRYPAGRKQTSYSIPKEVKIIGGTAFQDCANLEKIIFPETVFYVGESAFSDCKKLDKAIILSNSDFDIDVFDNCTENLTIYTNKPIIRVYAEDEGIKYVFCEKFPAVVDTETEMEIIEGETYTKVTPEVIAVNNIQNIELRKNGTKVEGYEIGNEITEEGNYTLIITEETGNKTEVNFTIKAKIEKEIVSISVKQNPNKTKYYKGEELNTEGLIIEVKYSDGSTEEITEGYTCTPTKLDTIGEQEITVSYEGQTTTFKVTVEEKEIVITKEESKYETETIADKECIIKIEPNTTIEEFKTNINDEYEVEVYNKDGEKETKEEEKIKTNMKIEIKKDGEKIAEYTLIVTGDVTGDGEANFTDILSINKHRLNRKQLGEIEEKAADVTGDRQVNFTDILKINKYRLGRIETL